MNCGNCNHKNPINHKNHGSDKRESFNPKNPNLDNAIAYNLCNLLILLIRDSDNAPVLNLR